MKKNLITAALIICTLTGCAQARKYTMPDEDNLLSGSGSILVLDEKAAMYETIDVTKLLDSYGFTSFPEVAKLDLKGNQLKYQRNELQDRIIAASNQRCGMYLRMLASSKAESQLTWSGLAVFLSGAASVVTPVNTAKALSAGSTVSNGILAQYNEAYFNNLAINVISSGITSQREGILLQINQKKKDDLIDYPVNRAIADAVQYHSVCNIISGLETAAVATRSLNAKNPPENSATPATQGKPKEALTTEIPQDTAIIRIK